MGSLLAGTFAAWARGHVAAANDYSPHTEGLQSARIEHKAHAATFAHNEAVHMSLVRVLDDLAAAVRPIDFSQVADPTEIECNDVS